MSPAQVLNWLMDFYHRSRGQRHDEPIIAGWSAGALSIAFTLIYVIPFYLSATTRPSPELSRDAPSVIRARIRAVSFSCVVCTLLTVYVCVNYAHMTLPKVFALLGWWPIFPLDVLRVLALVAILFVGPLFEAGIVEGKWRDWFRGRSAVEAFTSSIGWRNYIAGPLTEELVFRSLIIPLHLLATERKTILIFVTPLYFGIAHIHHFYEFTLTHPRTPLLPAFLRSVFQFVYTSVFGFFAGFVFLRTGSLAAAVVAHSFCNWMGLPRFWGKVEAPVTIGPQDIRRKEDLTTSNRTIKVADGQLGIGWTVAYYVLLVAGACGFYLNLWPLTKSNNALIPL